MRAHTTDIVWWHNSCCPSLLNQLHIVRGEKADGAVGRPSTPPTLVQALNVGDDVARIEGDLRIVLCRKRWLMVAKDFLSYCYYL